MERDVLDDAVALVEDAEHGDTLRHRRHAAFAVGGGRGLARSRRRSVRLLGALSARGQRQRNQQRCSNGTHVYSGIQGS
jgi:hypothetical protein